MSCLAGTRAGGDRVPDWPLNRSDLTWHESHRAERREVRIMRYMNDYDIIQARFRFGRGETPNRLALVLVVDQLRTWTNDHSDGWAYWPKPCRAAARAIELIESTAYPEYERRQHEDITDAEMLAAVRPIKAFLTGQKVTPQDRELILRAVDAPTSRWEV